MLSRPNEQCITLLNMENKENYLVGIYGSLRKGGKSHHMIAKEDLGMKNYAFYCTANCFRISGSS